MRIIILLILVTLGTQAQDAEPQPMKFTIDGVPNTELTPIEQDFFLTGFEYSGEVNFDTTLMNNSKAGKHLGAPENYQHYESTFYPILHGGKRNLRLKAIR